MNSDEAPDSPQTPDPASEPDDFKAMLIGAAMIYIVGLIPYTGLLCCLPQIFGVMLTLHLFTRWYRLTLGYGDGIKLGILTALLGMMALQVTAVALLLLAHYRVGGELEPLILRMFSFAGPDAVQKMKEAMEAQRNQGITLVGLVIGILSTVVGASITGLIGGALGAALFKRGPKPQD